VIAAQLSYTSPACWGLTSAADLDHLEAFLKQSTALDFRPPTAPMLGTICSEADDKRQTVCSAQRLNFLEFLNGWNCRRRDPTALPFVFSVDYG